MRYIPEESADEVLRLLPIGHCWRGVNPMDRADLYRLYELGAALHPLSQISSETALDDYFSAYVVAERALKDLLGRDPQIKVELCWHAACELRDKISEIEKLYFWDKAANKFKYPTDPAKKIGWVTGELKSALQNFEAVFRAEMQAAATYLVPKRGAFSTRDLVDAFDRAFLPELHQTIGEKGLGEYRNAGRCFAFGLWTAAGYHCCRAVEALLQAYYEKLTGKEATEGKTWGALIDGLQAVVGESQPNEKTIFYLRQLKDSERNPLMHVRVVLDEQDADLLIGSAKIVMILMARELVAIQKKEAPKGNALSGLQTIAGGAA
jgi:hypothetical protein